MTLKQEKIREAICHAAAEFLERESNRSSLVTVTGTTLSRRGDRAVILITVLPEPQEASALQFANRRAGALRDFLSRRVSLQRLPRISFALDRGEKLRQRLDELSGKNP
jgi:ribosome-binding factor A